MNQVDTLKPNNLIDLLEIHARIKELRVLEDGWFDGLGRALSVEGLDWLEKALRDHVSRALPRPRIYPVPEGHVLFEWSINSKAASLEIDLKARTGYWHVLDLKTKDDRDATLKLGELLGWKSLAERLAELEGDESGD